jgi:hypothetical protein
MCNCFLKSSFVRKIYLNAITKYEILENATRKFLVFSPLPPNTFISTNLQGGMRVAANELHRIVSRRQRNPPDCKPPPTNSTKLQPSNHSLSIIRVGLD